MVHSVLEQPASLARREDGGTEIMPEIIIYSHSTLFYWWPAWLCGLLFSIVNYVNEHRGSADDTLNSRLGLSYVVILLFLLIITNVRLRGLKSIVVILAACLIATTLAWFSIWNKIVALIPYLSVHIDNRFYIVFSTGLFLIWISMIFIFDRLTYWRIRPGQLTIEHRIGGAAESFDTNALRFHKLSSDLFRAVLGLGTGDLQITGINAPETTTYLPNVAFAGRKVQAIERMIVVKPDVVA